MKYKSEGKTLILYTPKRIESSNAMALDAEVQKKLADMQPQELIVNAAGLEYISSAGLRIILKLRKAFPDLLIVNVSPDVYNIFDVTGFTDMITIKKALRELDVSGCEIIDEGAQGAIYRIDPETIVKVSKHSRDIRDVDRERDLARKAFVMGIPTAISYDVVKVGDSFGAVFELLNAKSFAQLIREGEDVEELARQSADIMKIIHSKTTDDPFIPKKKPIATGWARRSANYLPAEIGDRLIALFEAIPDSNQLMHGDFHIKNVMRHNGEDLLIDMDTLSTGHPIYELSAVFAAYKGFASGDDEACARFLGITKEQCAAFLSAIFRFYFDDKTEEQIDEIYHKAATVSYTRIYRWLIEKYGLDDPEHKDAIAFCRDFLIENVPKIDKLYY